MTAGCKHLRAESIRDCRLVTPVLLILLEMRSVTFANINYAVPAEKFCYLSTRPKPGMYKAKTK